MLKLPTEPVPESMVDVIAAMESLMISRGWQKIVKILNDNITYLETAILERVDPITKVFLSDSDVDLLRIKRKLNIDLRETPQNYSQIVREAGEEPENYDPYFKTNDEIKQFGKKRDEDERGR